MLGAVMNTETENLQTVTTNYFKIDIMHAHTYTHTQTDREYLALNHLVLHVFLWSCEKLQFFHEMFVHSVFKR